MKICDSWLREWIDHGLDAEALAQCLTMLGLEVESITAAGEPVTPLRVGRVLDVQSHPNADRLSLCRVDIGTGEPLTIVCGAPDVRAGALYATALPGATLPGGLVIKAARIRGEPSAGMLCSAAELGLESATPGLLELDSGAEPGGDAAGILALGDPVLDLNITPNRADCFSVVGIAREVAAATGAALGGPGCGAIPAVHADRFSVDLSRPEDCPRFAGRVIRGIDAQAQTPLWMRERLRRCGVRPIHPVVDVTNYVMLELGQPMHAYDLGRLQEGIDVRRARPGEELRLLDGQSVRLDADMLVIADASAPIGLAGIMGGQATAVSASTTDVFLESAFFTPAVIAGRARRLGLHTDASLRFERGVDPSLQARAIERATRLILDIAGGKPGPVIDTVVADRLPERQPVKLRRARAARVLGLLVPDSDIEAILGRLGMRVVQAADGWHVIAPPARFDIEREEDLIEEVARVNGYERIPETRGRTDMCPAVVPDAGDALTAVRTLLVARGFQEAITYSFVAPELAHRFGATETPALALSNPISAEMAVMRQSLWPGLVQSVTENLHRQASRVRLFEVGTRFLPAQAGSITEQVAIAAVATGTRLPEQWGAESSEVDVFDLGADLAALCSLAGQAAGFEIAPASHPALHPGRSASIRRAGRVVGWIGEVHPELAGHLGLARTAVFEIEAAAILARERVTARTPSRFPAVRRDLAVVVGRGLPVGVLLGEVRRAAPAGILQDAVVFDIYTGPQIADSEKSVAIGLILQDASRTLTDADADGVLHQVKKALAVACGARFRE